MIDLYKKLADVQQAVRVRKENKNTFAGFSYWTCDDIFKALKDPLKDAGALVVVDTKKDGDTVEAVAAFIDITTGKQFAVSAFADIDRTKKGLDESQRVGSATTYARKYALTGLFCLDEETDTDARAGLEQAAESAACRGIGAYRVFFNSLTTQQKKQLEPIHENLKKTAERMDGMKG